MKLFSSPTSPYVRKVLVLLQETGQLDDVEMIKAGGTPLNSDNMPTDVNPLGKIPALVLDTGEGVFDSRVICRFFDDRAKAGVFGEGDDRWRIQTIEAAADGILDAAILMVYERRLRTEDKQWDDWVDAQWQKIHSALEMIETRWIDVLSWDFKLNMGQIAVACALGYIDFRHGDRDWRAACPKLAAWYAEACERDSIKSTVPVE